MTSAGHHLYILDTPTLTTVQTTSKGYLLQRSKQATSLVYSQRHPSFPWFAPDQMGLEFNDIVNK